MALGTISTSSHVERTLDLTHMEISWLLKKSSGKD